MIDPSHEFLLSQFRMYAGYAILLFMPKMVEVADATVLKMNILSLFYRLRECMPFLSKSKLISM